jgi:hypothetical protein
VEDVLRIRPGYSMQAAKIAPGAVGLNLDALRQAGIPEE